MDCGALDYVIKSKATLNDMSRIVERTLREWGLVARGKLVEQELSSVKEQLKKGIVNRQKTEEERDRLFEHSVDLLAIAQVNGYLKQINPAWTKTLGRTEHELLSCPYIEFIHPEDHDASLAAAEKLLATQELRDFENRFRCKDGTYRWLSWNCFMLPEEGLTFAVTRDITERKRVEQALQKSEARLKATHKSVAAGIAVLDAHGRYVEVNDKYGAMLGYSRAEIIGKSPFETTFQKDREASIAQLKRLLSGEIDSYRQEKRYDMDRRCAW